MGRFAGKRVEVKRHGSGKSFSFASLHFSDRPMVHCDSADDLYVIRDHIPFLIIAGDMYLGPEEPAAGIFNDGIGLWQDLVQGLPILKPLAEFSSFATKVLVGKRLQLFLPGVYLRDDLPIFF